MLGESITFDEQEQILALLGQFNVLTREFSAWLRSNDEELFLSSPVTTELLLPKHVLERRVPENVLHGKKMKWGWGVLSTPGLLFEPI